MARIAITGSEFAKDLLVERLDAFVVAFHQEQSSGITVSAEADDGGLEKLLGAIICTVVERAGWSSVVAAVTLAASRREGGAMVEDLGTAMRREEGPPR